MGNFELVKEGKFFGTNFNGELFRHKKTGMEVVWLDTNSSELFFDLSIRFNVKDGRGLPHILEHSVFNGSKNYNSITALSDIMKENYLTDTYAATTNYFVKYQFGTYDQTSFFNMVRYELEALLFPNVLNDESLFKRNSATLIMNKDNNYKFLGSCFNEEKSYYSDPGRDMTYTVTGHSNNKLYRFNAGGNPVEMIKAKHKDLIEFHKNYYTPANLRLIVSGNMDHLKLLDLLDKEFLVNFNDSKKPRIKNYLKVKEDEKEASNTYIPTKEAYENNLKAVVVSYEVNNINTLRKMQQFMDAFSCLDIKKIENELKSFESKCKVGIEGEYLKQDSMFWIKVENVLEKEEKEIAGRVERIINNLLSDMTKNEIKTKILNYRNTYNEVKYASKISPTKIIINDIRHYIEFFEFEQLIGKNRCRVTSKYIDSVREFWNDNIKNINENFKNVLVLNPDINKAKQIAEEIDNIKITKKMKDAAKRDAEIFDSKYIEKMTAKNDMPDVKKIILEKAKEINEFEDKKLSDEIITIKTKNNNYEEIIIPFILNGNDSNEVVTNYFAIKNIVAEKVKNIKININTNHSYYYSKKSDEEMIIAKFIFMKKDSTAIIKIINDIISSLKNINENNAVSVTIPKKDERDITNDLFEKLVTQIEVVKESLFDLSQEELENKEVEISNVPCAIKNIFIINNREDNTIYKKIDVKKLNDKNVYKLLNKEAKPLSDIKIASNVNYNGVIIKFPQSVTRTETRVIAEIIFKYLKKEIIMKGNVYNIICKYNKATNSLIYITFADKEVEYTKNVFKNIIENLKSADEKDFDNAKKQVFNFYMTKRLNDNFISLEEFAKSIIENEKKSNKDLIDMLVKFDKERLNLIINEIDLESDIKLLSFIK